jgi:hypothetical protein
MSKTLELMFRIQSSLIQIERNNSKTQVQLAGHMLMDSAEFEGFMKISSTVAYKWRQEGIIAFYQIRGKIYYKVRDVNIMLSENFFPSKTEEILVDNNLNN